MAVRWLALVAVAAMVPALAMAQDSSWSSEASSSIEPPPTVSDADLERAVRAAYNGAAAFASAHGNYFTRDDVFEPLRDAIRAQILQEGLGQFAVPEAATKSIDEAKKCLSTPGGSELRIVPTTFGDGIGLVAVSDKRVFIYDYDPHAAPDIKVTPAADCLTAN